MVLGWVGERHVVPELNTSHSHTWQVLCHQAPSLAAFFWGGKVGGYGAHPALLKGPLLEVFRGLYGLLGIEPRSASQHLTHCILSPVLFILLKRGFSNL